MVKPAAKPELDSVSRRIAARTMDGFKVGAKIALSFQRPIPAADAEDTLKLYVRAFASMLENELSEGRLPLDEATVHARITSRVKAVPKQGVRVSELHLVQDSGSSAPSMPASGRMPVGSFAPPSASYPPSASRPSAAFPASGSMPVSGRHSIPIPSSQRPMAPVISSAPPPESAGVFMFARAEPRSGFALALQRCPTYVSGAAAGRALSAPLRDAAASLLFAALGATQELLEDPLRFLDGTAEPALRDSIVTECCACVAYLLLQGLSSARLPQALAISVTQGASTQVVDGHGVPSAELSRYLAIENPAHELAGRLCALLDVCEPADMQDRLGYTLNSIRSDVRLCAKLLRERIANHK